MLDAWGATRTILVVGGGFSGTLFALAAAARPGLRVVLIEREASAGRGLAYGACDPLHVLNVPVARMEVGLSPSFGAWLETRGPDTAEALAEADGALSRAFMARHLFGAYLTERLDDRSKPDDNGPSRALVRVRGEAVRVEEKPRPTVLLADGRRLEGDAVVLATGNLPPKPPRCRDAWFYDTPAFVPDPWAWRERAALPPDAPVLLIGSGLTMVDVALRLAATGHTGPMIAVSRHGLLPHSHLPPSGQEPAGVSPPRLELAGASPIAVLRRLRDAVRQAEADGVPWQKVMDAARPHLPGIWSRWTLKQKARFLRHGRTLWDVHRHRMAPRIAAGLSALLARGQLRVVAGRIKGFSRAENGARVQVQGRAHGPAPAPTLTFDAAAVINCTGPRSDFGEIGLPLFADLRRAGQVVADPLGLGLETEDCAVVDRFGTPSPWLFAVGPLTRPAWWEITAVPEVSVQIHHLVERLAQPAPRAAAPTATLLEDFIHLGEGI